jgi:hypothetical protein
LPAGTHHLPKRSDCSGNVGHEKDTEHTDNRIEACRGKAQVEHVALPELDVAQLHGTRLGSRKRKEAR